MGDHQFICKAHLFSETQKMQKISLLLLGLVALIKAENWVDICQESSGNKCCAQDDTGMGTSSAQHLYWIMKQPGSWVDLDLICRTERAGSRLVTFESQRENDCVTKYIIKEFEDQTARDYAIGLSTDSDYPGIYRWNRITSAELATDKNAEAMSFQNWAVSSPTLSKGCVVLTAGVDDVNNGKWKDIECGTTSTTLYGICEYDGAS